MIKPLIFAETKPEVIDWKKEILKSIAHSGNTSSGKSIIIGSNVHLNNITDSSNGAVRLSRSVIKKFSLILSQPVSLSGFDKQEIRCALCERIIRYPCWYYEVKYAVNHFHYFICFSATRSDKPTTQCYRRE
jgi:hypothetical protein